MISSYSTSPVAAGEGTALGTSNEASHPLHLHYQDWSGFRLHIPSAPEVDFVFDPAPNGELPATEAVIAITHGHPEHVEGALAHVRRTEREAVTVLASAHVCRYLQRRSANAQDRFEAVTGGETVEARGWRVRVFGWEHMSLLPPNVWQAMGHLVKLARHPLRLVRMGWDSAWGPRHAPMLGFHVTPPHGEETLVYYGEGLHRRTTAEQLRDALGTPPAKTLLAGVEPEDQGDLPPLLGECYAGGRVILFEPHRQWRAQFGMEQVAMPQLLSELNGRGVDASTTPPGTNVTLA